MLKITFLLIGLLIAPAFAFVAPMEWDQKCNKSDVIIRGVVVEMVMLKQKVESSRGHENDTVFDQDFSGPNAVAMVRVTEVLKGDSKSVSGIILIPCGYDFDESPSELTKTKDYLLFLQSMGKNYFHPLDPFSMHRIQQEKVGSSGFDTDSDFEPDAKDKECVPYEDFVKRIKAALRVTAK